MKYKDRTFFQQAMPMCMDLIWWRHANNQNKTNTGCPADFVVNKFGF